VSTSVHYLLFTISDNDFLMSKVLIQMFRCFFLQLLMPRSYAQQIICTRGIVDISRPYSAFHHLPGGSSIQYVCTACPAQHCFTALNVVIEESIL
jgi:hypothetical protein